MHIGLIGGIGPAATDFYYRRLIGRFAQRGAALELTIVHADAPTLLTNLAAGNADGQIGIYCRLTERLVAAGADCVVVTSIAGHFCIDGFKAVSPLPVIDMIGEIDRAVVEHGFSRVGILGTRTVMATRLYGKIEAAELVPPPGNQLDAVHNAYAAMAAAGSVTPMQRGIFDDAVKCLLDDQGVDAIMLGGTDLALVYSEDSTSFPLIDCAAVHVDAIAALALPKLG